MILCACLGSGCHSSPPVQTSTTLPRPAGSDQVPADPQWQRDLEFWLDVGYTEDGQEASFASVSPDLVGRPSLYATYSAVGIHAALGQAIPQPEAVGGWIQSLMEGEGAFYDNDPYTKYPRLIETLWAVSALSNLGAQPRDPAQVIAFVLSLQNEDGWFHSDQAVGGDPTEQNLVATDWAAETLSDLHADAIRFSTLKKTQGVLQAYLLSHLAEESPALTGSGSLDWLVAAHALALSDPAAMPEAVRRFLQQALGAATLAADPGSVARVNLLFAVARLIGLSAPESQSGQLRHTLEEQVLPSFTAEGGYASKPGTLEPMTTYTLVQLTRQLQVSYPYSQALFRNLDKYRIERGWITFVIPTTNPQFTFYALGIAARIAYTRYDPAKVVAYLKHRLQPQGAALNLQDAYSAVSGLALLKQKVDEATMTQLQAAAVTAVQAEPEAESDGDLETLALLSLAERWEWPASLRNRAADAIRRNAAAGLPRIDQIRLVALLQSAAGVEIVPREEIKTRLLALEMPNGGFKAISSAPTPDLDSTFQAVDVLSRLGYGNVVDRTTMQQFVHSCQDEYGFNYIPPALVKQDPQVYSVQATLASTWEGLELLGGASQ